MVTLRTAGAAAIGLILLAAFNACGKFSAFKSGAAEFGSCSPVNKTRPDDLRAHPVFAAAKVHASTTLADANARWVVLLDHQCARTQTDGLAFELYNSPARLDLETQAYTIDASVQTESELQAAACVIGASLENPLRAFNLPIQPTAASDPDPFGGMQEHLTFLSWTARLQTLKALLGLTQKPTIAVIDTGVDYTHEDLKDVMWTDAQGRFGVDLIQNDGDPMDPNGHGTHVAGLAAAATENGIGGSGVGFARIMAVRALNAQGATSVDVLANAITWAAQNGADVINMSLGGTVQNLSPVVLESLRRAIERNVVVITAAGNDNRQLGANFRVEPASHAREFNGMVAVGSVDTSTGLRSAFSNFGAEYVELMAPGAVSSSTTAPPVGLLSTVPGAAAYQRMPGTSMASPLVAGAAANLIADFRLAGVPYTNAMIEERLRSIARTVDGLSTVAADGKVLDFQTFTLTPAPVANLGCR